MTTGVLLSLTAALLGTGKDVVSKSLAANVDGALSAFASFAFALPFYLLGLIALWLLGYEDFAFGQSFFWLVVGRSITDALAEMMKMKAFESGEISMVSGLISLSPLFLLITSPLITGDYLATGGVFAVLMVVFGTCLLSWNGLKASSNRNQPKAVIFSLASAFFFSLNICLDRLAVQVASPILSGFAMTLVAGLFLLPSFIRSTGSGFVISSNFRAFSLRGAIEFFYMVLKLSALQFLQAPYVACIMKVNLIFSVIAGTIMFGERDTGRKILAAGLIFLGIVLIILEQTGG